MIWQAIFAVALAAPVWSHPHNHRHKRPTTVTTWTTVTGVASTAATDAATEAATNVVSYTAAAADVEVVQTSSTAQATSYAVVAASETAQAATTYAVEAVQSTASAETTSTAAVATSTASTPGRAVWLWQSNLLQDDTEVAEFLSWSTSNDITTVYTLIDRDMGDAVFQSFIEQCTTVGISVEALMGDADWILGAGDPTLESQLTWLENYQGNSSTSALFSGIHVDVEVRIN